MVLGCLEEGLVDDRPEVRDVEQSRKDQRPGEDGLSGGDAPDQQVPLADEASHERDTSHAGAGDGEGRHRQGHPAANTSHLRDQVGVGFDVNGPGTEKEGELHERVRRDVQQTTDDSLTGEHGESEHDVGQLADRRVRQPAFEVVLPERDHTRHRQRDHRHRRQREAHPQVADGLGAEHVERHAGDPEDTAFDDRHGV